MKKPGKYINSCLAMMLHDTDSIRYRIFASNDKYENNNDFKDKEILPFLKTINNGASLIIDDRYCRCISKKFQFLIQSLFLFMISIVFMFHIFYKI